MAPGSSYTGTFKVHNAGAAPFSYTTTATPYSVVNDNYDPDYNSTTTYSQMADWITFDQKTGSGTLQPGQVVDVEYYVNVPEDVPAGAQYAALMAQTESGNDDNATVGVIHRVGMILYATVPGETRIGGEVIKNNINSFYFNPPVSVTSLVKNTGNVEQTAKITTNIWPLFSKETAFSNQDSPVSIDVIPDTSRFNSITWDGAPSLGIFWAQQRVEFAGEVSNVEKFIIICPLWLLFIIFAIIFFIIFWLISRHRNRKRAARGEAKAAHAHSSERAVESNASNKGKEEK